MTQKPLFSSACLLLLFLSGCTTDPAPTVDNAPAVEKASPISESTSHILSVTTTPTANGEYTFAVTIESPDTGCDRYANWWEVIDEQGNLLYRRTLAHSHIDEQPFTRSGGPVVAEPDDVLIVRSHMHPTGYSPQAQQGTLNNGFEPTTLPTDFATELSEVEPLPSDCNF